MAGPRAIPWPDGTGRAVETVRGGGVVAIAFERLFGLAADAMNAEAVERVVSIKGQAGEAGRTKPISVVAADREELRRVASGIPALAARLADAYWPGPLTLLVPARPGLPAPLVGPGGLIGVRVPGASPAADLCRASGLVLTATSANVAGGPEALGHEDLESLDGVDLVVEGRVPGPPGSTVVDASGGRARIVRAGAVEIAEDMR